MYHNEALSSAGLNFRTTLRNTSTKLPNKKGKGKKWEIPVLKRFPFFRTEELDLNYVVAQ